MFNNTIQSVKEWYIRFRGRNFYNRVNKVYNRSKELTQERINRQNGGR